MLAHFFQFDTFFDMFFILFGALTVVFFVIFFVVLFVIVYFICRAVRASTKTFGQIRTIPRRERAVVRETLPPECPQCDAPLKFNEVRWVGPRQAECPYCGQVVELQTTEISE